MKKPSILITCAIGASVAMASVGVYKTAGTNTLFGVDPRFITDNSQSPLSTENAPITPPHHKYQ